MSNRVSEHNGDFCYDLADGRTVKTTSKGWSIVDDNPPLSKSYSHQQPQVEPIRGGDIRKLFDFINIVDDSNRLLCLVSLVGCFVPNIPHPIVHPYGDQGAGKTSFCTTQKRLVDPSKLSVIIAPKNQEEAVQILEEHYLCTFDNLSTIPDWLSDLISQACTGGGYSKRKLYTDSESIIYQIQRCVVINGINLLISRADLMDRTILLRLERIESSKRREWKALLNEFEESLPYLLGSIFDALSRAMAIYPTIRLSSLPRMADFVVWGSAIAQALGFKVEDFTAAYQMNIEAQNSEVINCNTLAQAVLAFMADKDLWNGTVREAFEELGKLVTVSKEDKSFPKHSNKLRGHLSRIKPNLLDYGIKLAIADYDVAHKGCPMSFQKVPKVSSLSSCIPKANTGAGLRGEDKSGINERPEGIPTVSRQPEPGKIKGSGIHEDNEHPKQTFWKDANKQSEEDIPEVEFVEVISNV